MIVASAFIPRGPLISPPGMHIPDGFLSLSVSVALWVLTVAVVAVATRRVQSEVGERLVPLMGVMAAFIFAAQMINFPVVGGTSGHLLGGALAAILLGPWPGMLVTAVVIALQGLLFQDGGLVVMGANILNMGLITAVIGYGLFRGVLGRPRTTRLAVAGVGAWLSVTAAALATSLELWLSGTSALRVVVPAMLGIHAVIGVGEALITVAALAFIWRSRPDLESSTVAAEPGGRGWVVAGLVAALGVVLLSPFASVNPDGLERVAEDLGFLGAGRMGPVGLMPDYILPLLGQGRLSTVVAGAIGVVVVATVVVVGSRVLRLRRAGRSVNGG